MCIIYLCSMVFRTDSRIIYKYVSFHSHLNHSYIVNISVLRGTRSWIN
jgi:hypothetical protein